MWTDHFIFCGGWDENLYILVNWFTMVLSISRCFSSLLLIRDVIMMELKVFVKVYHKWHIILKVFVMRPNIYSFWTFTISYIRLPIEPFYWILFRTSLTYDSNYSRHEKILKTIVNQSTNSKFLSVTPQNIK